MSLEILDMSGFDIASPDMEPAVDALRLDLGKSAILLDIDGTILDFAPSPRQVSVPADLRETLTRLNAKTNGALALVSGRPVADIDSIFAPLEIAAIGGHGAEWRSAIGGEVTMRTKPLDPALKHKLLGLGALGPGVLTEDKGYSLALHYRLAPEKAEAVRAAVEAVCAQAQPGTVEILPGKFVIEIKPTGISKASAVRDLMKLKPFVKRKPIFIGDDVTDEPVFAVVAELGGLGFSVGRVSAAVNGRFPNPHAVRAWLARLAAGKGEAE